MIAVAAAAVAVRQSTRLGRGEPVVVGLWTWGLVAHPVVAVAVGSVVIARRRWRRAVSARIEEQSALADLPLLAELTALGLRSGLPLRASLELSASHVHGSLARDVAELTAAMERGGSQAGLADPPARLAPLARVVETATLSGSPTAAAIEEHAESLRHEQHMAQMAKVRRLPVRLLLPLALLILPGFVILTVGPAVLESLARLNPSL